MPVHRPKRPFPLALLLDIGITPDPEGAHAPTPRCSNIAVFRRQRPTDASARSRSRLRERPCMRWPQPAPRADPPGMVGRERRGGRQRRAGRATTYTPVQPATSLGESSTVLADSERARPPRSSPDPASTAAPRRAAAVAGRRAAEGFRVFSPPESD